MSEVIDLAAKRAAKEPHNAGVAVCSACKHEWAAVAPLGTLFLDCPVCELPRGRFVHPTLLQEGVDRKECGCGCQMFMANTHTRFCINCGEEYSR